MYFFQLALCIQFFEPDTAGQAISWAGMWGNLVPVILGNLVGGSVLVGLVYHLIYRVAARTLAPTPPQITK